MRSVGDYFREDHVRLDELFRKFQAEKHSDLGRARKYFEAFKFRLESHIVWEEELLFPIFEVKTKMRNPGLTAVMRTEHAQIRETLATIHAQTKNQNPHSEKNEAALLNVLGVHNQKEEESVYPIIDDAANDRA